MTESSIVVAQQFVRAINRQDVDAMAALMSDEHRFIDSLGNAVTGSAAMRAGWAGYFRMVPDYTIAVEEIYSDGPVVILLGAAQGAYSTGGALEPENRWSTPVALRAFVEEGKIAEWRVYADNEPIRKLMARPG
ncbi:MAG: nuclear transport factor 2 family protein [Terracidiphilus sp.]